MEYIYRSPEFEKVVNEYFDLTDKETFSYLRSIEEADQNKLITALTSKLYDKMVEKVDQIDFGDIPKSRGDITKLPNYEKVVDCIDIIKGILINSKQDLEPILIIENTVKNLNEYKDIFIRGYQLNMEMPMMIYNTVVLSVYSGLSVLISSCIEFIKSTDNTGFDIALDKVQLKKTKDSLLFRNLKMINMAFNDKSLPESLNAVLRQNTNNFVGTVGVLAGIKSAAMVMTVLLFIFRYIKDIVYYFYFIRVKVSDYFDAQSALLQMNAYNLAAKGSNNEKDIKEIQEKQLKIANGFKKIANVLEVKKNKAEVAAEKESKNFEKKLKIGDVSDSLW